MTGAPPTCTQSIQDKLAYGPWIQRVWFDGGGGGWEAYFQFLTSDSFREMLCWMMAFCPKEVVNGQDHSIYATEVGKEKPQGLIHSNKGERLIRRSNKREICHVTSSGIKRIHWACQVVVVDGQPKGWWATLKECPPQTIKSW